MRTEQTTKIGRERERGEQEGEVGAGRERLYSSLGNTQTQHWDNRHHYHTSPRLCFITKWISRISQRQDLGGNCQKFHGYKEISRQQATVWICTIS